jgi:membrane-associated phospholipid phosphatase
MLRTELRQFLHLFLLTGREMVATPSRWSGRQWLQVLVSLATALLAYAGKWQIQDLLSRRGGEAVGFLASMLNVCGSGFSVLGLGCVAYLIVRWTGRSEPNRMILVLAAGGAWCWLLTRAGQWVFAEQRPNEGGVMHFGAMGGHGVSGHASAAALLYSPVLSILAKHLGTKGRRAVRVGLLGWASLVGWSRVYLGMHFLWNVALGFAIGSLAGSCAARVVTSTTAPCDPGLRR